MNRTAEEKSAEARKALSPEEQIEALEAELKARIVEADWLKAHYDDALRGALAEVQALQARLKAAPPPASHLPSSSEDEIEMKRLRQEVERLTAAERRYLDRIEELKELLAGKVRDR